MSDRRPGAKPVGISVLLHVAVLVPVLVATHLPEPIEFETVKIHLVAAPPAAAQAPALVETDPQPAVEEAPPEVKPKPVEKAVEEPAKKPPEPKPEPKPKPKPEPETEKRPEAPKPKPEPEEKAETGGDGINIATEGKDFPFPDYLENVIIQIHRYLRWNDATEPQMLIYFEITSDGSVRNVRPLRRSGNPVFDFRVMGAIEAAANRKAFGPLPDGYAADVLPIQLEVAPAR